MNNERTIVHTTHKYSDQDRIIAKMSLPDVKKSLEKIKMDMADLRRLRDEFGDNLKLRNAISKIEDIVDKLNVLEMAKEEFDLQQTIKDELERLEKLEGSFGSSQGEKKVMKVLDNLKLHIKGLKDLEQKVN